MQILFLWRNDQSVIIGRNQNPWSECNLSRMKEDEILLARRTTGGGAVFHDLGNTNFTFLSPKENYSRKNNIEIISTALQSFGIPSYASGRNDILIDTIDGPRKMSGSAYREKKDRAFHHGTLLLHADLMKLANYLTPNPKKLQAKGKESVRSQVANLSEISKHLDHQKILPALITSFEKFYDARAEIETLSLSSLEKIPELKAQFENLSSFEWLYGQTLEFNQQMDEYLSLGYFDFRFRVQDATINDLQIFSDCLHPQIVDELKSLLSRKAFLAQSVREAFKIMKTNYNELLAGLEELENWLCQQIEI